MLRTQRCAELDDVGDQPCEPRRAKVAQSAIGGAPVPTMIDGVNHEPGCIQRLRKAVIAFAMLGESVGDLHHCGRCAGNVGPGVRHHLGAVGIGDKRGGGCVHRLILTRRRLGVIRGGRQGGRAGPFEASKGRRVITPIGKLAAKFTAASRQTRPAGPARRRLAAARASGRASGPGCARAAAAHGRSRWPPGAAAAPGRR